MNLETCLADLRAYIKTNEIRLPEAEIRRFAEEMARELQANPSRARLIATMDAKLAERASVALNYRALGLMKIAKREAFINNYRTNKTLGFSAYEHMRTTIEGGSIKGGYETNLDIMNLEDNYRSSLDRLSKMDHDLQKTFEGGEIDRHVFLELDQLQRGLKVGVTGVEEAGKIAERVYQRNRWSAAQKKAMNPLFSEMQDFYAHVDHDAAKVLGDGSPEAKAKWVARMMTDYNENSYPGFSPLEKQVKFAEAYDHIASEDSHGQGGPAGAMAHERVLIPNGPEEAYRYNRDYGSGTLAAAVFDSNIRDARHMAKLEKFIDDGWFDDSYRAIKEVAAKTELKELISREPSLRASFRTATNRASSPAYSTQAKLVQGALKFASWLTTGKAAISSMPDLALSVATVADSAGRNVGEVAQDLIGYGAKFLTNGAERAKFLEASDLYTRAYAHTIARDLGTAPNPAGGMRGKVESAVNWVDRNWSKITLIEYEHAAHRAAIAAVTGKLLAEDSELAFGSLNEQGQRARFRYGIGPEEQAIMKYAKVEVPGEKGEFVLPQGAQNIPDVAIENWMRKTGQIAAETENVPASVLDRGRLQYGLKLAAYLNEHAQLGTSSPGTRQRALMYGGHDINTGRGQAYRLMWQLKQASLVSADVVRRTASSSDTLTGKMAGMATMGSGLVFMSALSYYIKSTLTGKTPEAPTTLRFATTVLAQAGLGGPTADILLNAMQQNGVTDMALAAFEAGGGPVASKLVEGLAIAGMSAKAKASGKNPPMGRLGKFMGDLVPMQNMIGVGPLWNFYFTNAMREKLNPGYIGRVTNQTHQTPGLLEDRQSYMVLDPRESPKW